MEESNKKPMIIEERQDSPIPIKIQQALEKFQEQLSEKDVQILELQKQVENLHSSDHLTKTKTSQLVRSGSVRTSRDGVGRLGAASGAPSDRPARGKFTRAVTYHFPGNGGNGAKCKSRSVPSSPSKKVNLPPKVPMKRPPSCQALTASEHSGISSSRGGSGRNFIERNKTRYRNGTSRTDKTAETKPRSSRAGKSGATSSKQSPSVNGRGDATTVKIGTVSSSGKNGDSASTCSAESRASSAADYVSVSGSPSPGLSIDGSNHTDGGFSLFLGDESLSYAELSARLRRMTEEHGRLQAEHSRVLAKLAEKCREDKGTRIIDSTEVSISEFSGLVSERNHTEMIESSSENTLASTDSEQLFSEQKNSSDSVREYCKQEVLRLREEMCLLRKLKAEVEKRLEDSGQQIKELQTEKLVMKENIDTLNEKLRTSGEEIVTLQKSCEEKDARIVELEKEIDLLQKQCHHQQRQLELKEEHVQEFKRQLNEKCQAFQDFEKEANESKEFLQFECSTLSESLADAEVKLKDQGLHLAHLQAQLEVKSQNLQELQQTGELQKLEINGLQDNLDQFRSLTEDMLLQDINLTSALSSLLHLSQSLEQLASILAAQIDPATLAEIKEDSMGTKSFSISSSSSKPVPNIYATSNSNSLHKTLMQTVLEAISAEASTDSDSSSTLVYDESSSDVYLSPMGVSDLDNSSMNRSGEGLPDIQDETVLNNNNEESSSPPLMEEIVGNEQSYRFVLDRNNDKLRQMIQIIEGVEKIVTYLRKLLKEIHNVYHSKQTEADKESEQIQSDLKKQCRISEGRCKTLQEELKLAHTTQEQLRNDLKEAKERQMQLEYALQNNEERFNEFAQKHDALIDQQHQMNVLREQLQQLTLSKNLLEAERQVHTEQLEEMVVKIRDLTENNQNGNPDSSLADVMKEKISLKNEIQNLKLQIMDREREISALRNKQLHQQEIVLSRWKLAECEVSHVGGLYTQVLETLRNIPDIVASCEPLRKLWDELEDDEGRPKNVTFQTAM